VIQLPERREVLCKKLELIKGIVGEVNGTPSLELGLADGALSITEYVDGRRPLKRRYEVNARGDYKIAYILLSMLYEVLKNKEFDRWDIKDSIEIGLLRESNIYTDGGHINQVIRSSIEQFKIFEEDTKIRATYDLMNKVLVKF